MSIITISRGSYSRGKEVAEKLSQDLGYECVSREILLEASEEFNIPELNLVRAIHDSPSILERFRQGKERYISYYQYALLKHVQRDNVVYHGLAGQYFLRDISHVLKIRILASMEDRLAEVIKRDGIAEKQALLVLQRDDEERRRWGVKLYGTDTWDSRLYDMVILIDRLSVADAVDLIIETVKLPVFQTTAASQLHLDNQLLSAKVYATLVNFSLLIDVKVKDGIVTLYNVNDVLRKDRAFTANIEDMIKDIDGVKEIVFAQKVHEKGDYVNPFHNLD